MSAYESSEPVETKFRNLMKMSAEAALVVITVFALYLVRADNPQTTDPMWAPYLTASLLYDGDLFLDEYAHWIEHQDYFAVIKADDRLISFFPVGGPILAVLPAIILDVILPQLQGTTLQKYLLATPPGDPTVQLIQLITASMIVALSAGVIYLIGRVYLPPAYALVVMAVYAFGTSAYSTASGAMWQHGPSALMVSISLLLLIKAQRRPDLIRWVAPSLAAAYIMRPTNVISVVVVTLFVLLCYRQYFVPYALLGLSLGIPFIFLNMSLYDNWLPPYYAATRLQLSPTFLEALLGNLFSPARGLLIFSPIFLLLPVGIGIRIIRKKWTSLDWTILIILGLHWLTISSFPHWWAGHSFGPRFFTDVLPYAIYFLIPVLEEIHAPNQSLRIRSAFRAAFAMLAVVGIAIHSRGVASAATLGWNSVPLNIDEHPNRLWDWTDVQFLRGIGDDLIAVSPSHINAAVNAAPGKQEFYLDIGLMTDGPIDIMMRFPSRVSPAEQTGWLFKLDPLPGGGQIGTLREPLTGIGSLRLFIEIDATDMTGEATLRAIELVATQNRRGNNSRQETQIITVSITPEQSGEIIRPHDIAIHCVPATSGELYALFGAGWYDEETAGDSTWRWAASPANVYVWTDAGQTATLEIVPSSMYVPGTSDGLGQEGVLRVTGPGGKTALALQTGYPTRFDMPLQPGWNTLAFELEAGYFRPTDLIPDHYDARDLGFSIDDLSLSGECGPSVSQP